MDAVALVLRGFEDPDVPTQDEAVNPLADLETLETELILADVGAMDRRIEKIQGQAKARPRDFADQLAWLGRLRSHLNTGQAALGFGEPAHHADWTTELNLLSAQAAAIRGQRRRGSIAHGWSDRRRPAGAAAAEGSHVWCCPRCASRSWQSGNRLRRPRTTRTWACLSLACTSSSMPPTDC